MALYIDDRGLGLGLDVFGWGIFDRFALWERRWAGRSGFVLDWIGSGLDCFGLAWDGFAIAGWCMEVLAGRVWAQV